MSELFCPIHGPYDASYGSCPYCSGILGFRQPPQPQLLDEVVKGTFLELGDRLSVKPKEEEDSTVLGDESEILGILWVKEGKHRGRIYKVREITIIGRTQGDVLLPDPKVSNPHAKLTLEEGRFVLWDFGSKNGTFVNGERVRSATPLKENDIIQIGDTIFVLKLLGE